MKYLIIDSHTSDYAKTDDSELAKKLANCYLVFDTEHDVELGGKFGANIPVDDWNKSWNYP